MHFFSDFETASQDILFKVGQEAVSKYGEKGAKSGCSEYWDRFKSRLQVGSSGFYSVLSKSLIKIFSSLKRLSIKSNFGIIFLKKSSMTDKEKSPTCRWTDSMEN